ncbi:MAG: type II toxin-antitoxin system VapC family toxin [Gemmatimonadetes bacterium]|nr:type II toxin-antitoxin system VapC family toxin [Gemmatimonadota bacterium]
MILVDTDLVIYAQNPAYPAVHRFMAENETAVSAVSYVEALGYDKLDPVEKMLLERYFADAEMFEMDRRVLDRAVALRQQAKFGLGDSLIAATALEHGLTLATNNTKDFVWIPGLQLVNPLASN